MNKIYFFAFFKKAVGCLALLLLPLFGFAQWTQVGYMAITPDTATTVNMYVGFGSNLYSATNKGVFISMDNGSTWTNLTFTVPVTQTLTMMSLWEEPTSVLFAGGSRRLYKSTNNGASWTWIPLSIDSVSINEIQRSGANLVLSFNKGFNKGGAYYSTDNGATWNLSSGIPVANPMYDMHVEADTVYIAGTGGIYKSTDKGVNFSFLGNGTNVGLRTITRHQGNLFAGDVGGTGLYVSVNNGGTWTPANASVFAGFCQVFSVAQSPFMILASVDGATTCNGGNPIKASTDGGLNWTPFMSGVSTGFYPKLGTNSSGSSFFTNKGKLIYRTGGSSGISERQTDPELKLYFDAEKNLTIEVPLNESVDLKIYSASGSLVYNGQLSDQHTKIREFQSVSSGVYFVCLSSGDKMIRGKVLKQD